MKAALTKLDHAKYPFTNEASEYVRNLSIDIGDLTSPEFSVVLDSAERRVTDALTFGRIDVESQDEVGILAYPTALMLLALVGDEPAYRRYALAESKRSYELMRKEPRELLLQIAEETFKWRAKIIDREIGEAVYEFELFYADYLRNAVRIRDPDWKLTNRVLEQGYVCCDKNEFARLLKEEVEVRVLSKLVGNYGPVPQIIGSRVERIRKLALVRAQMYRAEEIPRSVLSAAMPPCMKALLSGLSNGKHLSHIARFAVTAFLNNIGVTAEEIVKMFHAQSDFTERIARYQVEHISGRRGGRKKYTAPNCKTMKTHAICINPDEMCATISNPLSYYRKKARTITAATMKDKTATRGRLTPRRG